MPSKEIMAMSVVPAPTSTIKCAVGCPTAKRPPKAAARGCSKT
jgi:hypothetical protein